MSSDDPTSSADQQLAFELLRRADYGRVVASMRALPFLAVARHIVVGGQILLRMHKGYGYHQACVGSVVAYGADNLDGASARDGQWTVQCVGLCEAVEPTNAELELFGPSPHFADGELFDPVYLRIEPQVTTVHTLHTGHDRRLQRVRVR
ncbi:pyridoxamine 5'-phosphate oxidase family protein [Streptomyces huasconensis]|uniref:Pyridoxamine 5'-phosphate oxidase family protein n=1 Tax=Streptomyces huasconensis TaxID=1854574 RepID=A0ABV3LTB6_9ACTN